MTETESELCPDCAEIVLRVIGAYEAEANAKVKESDLKTRPLMHGYWRSVAIHIRNLRRRFEKLSGREPT